MANKNQLTAEKPLEETIRLLSLDGHAQGDIIDSLVEQHGINKLKKAFEQVGESFRAIAAEPTLSVYGWSMEASRRCFSKMVEVGDYTGALRAAKQVADLRDRAADAQNKFLDI